MASEEEDEDARSAKTVDKYDIKRKQIENEVKTLLQKWRGKETETRLVRVEDQFEHLGTHVLYVHV